MKKIIVIFGWCLFAMSISAQILQNGDILVGSGNSSQILIYRDGVQLSPIHFRTSNVDGYRADAMCFSTNDKKYLFAANSYGTISSRITLFIDRVCTDEMPDGLYVDNVCRDEILGNTANIFDNNSLQPISVVADIYNNIYVGTSSYSTTTPRIYKFNLAGDLINTYYPELESRGYTSIDLSIDQSTLYYVDGNKIKRYNIFGVEAINPPPAFITLPNNQQGISVRLRSTNEVFVVCEDMIYRYKLDGRLLNRYPVYPCLANVPEEEKVYYRFKPMCFDIDPAYFWAVVHRGSPLYPIRMVKVKIDDGSPGTYVNVDVNARSFLVYGAQTAATTECSDGIDNDGNGLIDYPDDPNCSSCVDNSECLMFLGMCLRKAKVLYYFAAAGITLLVVGSILLFSYRKRRIKNKIR